MSKIAGKSVLVTGVTGMVGLAMTERLVADGNEVWGICRFTDAEKKKRCEELGVRTAVVDFNFPDFSELPERFDYIIHLAADVIKIQGEEGGEGAGRIRMPQGEDFFAADRCNALGTGRLMSHFRTSGACLIMSSLGVYQQTVDGQDPDVVVDEHGYLGWSHRDTSIYASSKHAQEVVARFCAQEYGLPTVIPRLGLQITSEANSLAWSFVMGVAAGMPMPVLHSGQDVYWQCIHEADMYDHLPRLFELASTTDIPTINWVGPEIYTITECLNYIAQRLGRDPVEFVDDPAELGPILSDVSKMNELLGPVEAGWKECFDRVIDDVFPDVPRL